MNKQQLLEKLYLINEMAKKRKKSRSKAVSAELKSPKDWMQAEEGVKTALQNIGHPQCSKKGGCGHQVDAMVSGVGISIGHGSNFSSKDVGQGTLTLVDDGKGGRKWKHNASSSALMQHTQKKQFSTALVNNQTTEITKQPSTLLDIMHAHYGTDLKAPKRPIRSGRERKHLNDEAFHIHKKGEIYLPINGQILGDHHKNHHGSLYHIQHENVGGTKIAHLYRTTDENPLNITDKQGNPPPILGQGLDVRLRIRAKDSTKHKKTGFYTRRAVTAIKVYGKVKDTPSPINLLQPHQTIHSSSGIFTNDADRIEAKKHEK